MRTHSAEELHKAAAEFVAGLSPRETATIVALSGELGAGKTTFVQGVARALGVDESVTSPTFVLEKMYLLKGQKWQRLIHIDAYRLESEHELEVLGWHKLAADPGNLILIEWPEKVSELIPTDAISIRFEIEGDARIISINDGKESDEKN